jgi:uncharacterized protein (TIGR02284 family)
MDKEKEIVSVVHHLIERAKDGEKGYRTASHDVHEEDLKSLFRQYAVQRDNMITELQDQLHQMGKTQDESGSLEGTIHRSWLDLSSAIVARDRKRILSECERGEDYAVSAYEKAMKADLPSNLKAIVEKQYQQVKEAHDHIRNLRDEA